MTTLYDVLNTSYNNKKDKKLKKQGYIKDKKLSSHNQKVFYNPVKKDLIFNVAGTHNIKDWITDGYLAVGKLKDTSRYKQAKNKLEKAKAKYNPIQTNITGHSLGGAIASYIGNKKDNVLTYNKGATIGQKTRKNETAIRTGGDVVSLFNAGAKRTQTIQGNNKNIFTSHAIDNLKNKPIFI